MPEGLPHHEAGHRSPPHHQASQWRPRLGYYLTDDSNILKGLQAAIGDITIARDYGVDRCGIRGTHDAGIEDGAGLACSSRGPFAHSYFKREPPTLLPPLLSPPTTTSLLQPRMPKRHSGIGQIHLGVS